MKRACLQRSISVAPVRQKCSPNVAVSVAVIIRAIPGEGLEGRIGQQHHEGLAVDDHARGVVIGALRVEGDAYGP